MQLLICFSYVNSLLFAARTEQSHVEHAKNCTYTGIYDAFSAEIMAGGKWLLAARCTRGMARAIDRKDNVAEIESRAELIVCSGKASKWKREAGITWAEPTSDSAQLRAHLFAARSHGPKDKNHELQSATGSYGLYKPIITELKAIWPPLICLNRTVLRW